MSPNLALPDSDGLEISEGVVHGSARPKGALRCEPGGKRGCTKPGTLRWSMPLPGDYHVNELWLDAGGLTASGTVTAHDLRTGAVVGKPLKLGTESLGPVVRGRSVEWSQASGDEVDRVRTRDLANGRTLGDVSVIGFRPALVWPRGGWDETEVPDVVWTAGRRPVLLGLGCAPDSLGRAGEPSACAKPRLLAFNR
jgi:hypothetical protein